MNVPVALGGTLTNVKFGIVFDVVVYGRPSFPVPFWVSGISISFPSSSTYIVVTSPAGILLYS